GYRTDGITQSALWPFADYSPELVALRWASAHGVPARFIDAPVGVALARSRAAPALEVHGDGDDDTPPDSDDSPDDVPGRGEEPPLARRTGMRSFDEAWDALIEAPHHAPADVRALLLAYAELVRATSHRDAARDAVMARHIVAATAAGVAAEQIAVVVGAA